MSDENTPNIEMECKVEYTEDGIFLILPIDVILAAIEDAHQHHKNHISMYFPLSTEPESISTPDSIVIQ